MMRPAAGVKKPVIRLKNVVLPAPFGPIMARSSPGATVIEILLTATRLPKFFDTFLTCRRMMTPPWVLSRRECREGEQHDQHEEKSNEDLPVDGDA